MEFSNYKEDKLAEKLRRIQYVGMSKEEFIKSFDPDEVDLISKTLSGLDIEKGQKANIGEIRDWGGKKFKKQSNGKWLEVSEHGMTKQEHKSRGLSATNSNDNKDSIDERSIHSFESSKLDDKEYSDEELSSDEPNTKFEHNGVTVHVGLDRSGGQHTITYQAPEVSDKKFWNKGELLKLIDSKSGGVKPKYRQVNYDGVREWSGKDLTNKEIESVLDSLLDEVDVTFTEMEVESEGSQEMFQDAVQEKVNELYSDVRQGMWPLGMSKSKIRDILWGVVMDRSLGNKKKSIEPDIEKKEEPKKEAKVAKVMAEFKAGTLKTFAGDLVTDRDQAIAIAMSEAGINKGSGCGDMMEKAEGDRGGKVIGHTDSGKPIYENHDHPFHAKFSKKDHYDAGNIHPNKEQAEKHREIARAMADKRGEGGKHPGLIAQEKREKEQKRYGK